MRESATHILRHASRSRLGSISSLRCQKSRKQHPGEDAACEVMFRGRFGNQNSNRRIPMNARCEHGVSSLSHSNLWWRQTGSNRRPHACKARALPAELCPRSRRRMLNAYEVTHNELVGLGRLELPTSRLSSARSNQLSYKPQRREARPACRRTCNVHRSTPPLARVRPRRKRNEDGGVPPMQLNNPDDRWPLMFLKRFDSSKLLKNHP